LVRVIGKHAARVSAIISRARVQRCLGGIIYG
jgi:hypothetical protein